MLGCSSAFWESGECRLPSVLIGCDFRGFLPKAPRGVSGTWEVSGTLEHKLAAAPKKARKGMFSDSFIFHAARAWLMPESDPFEC